MQGKRISQNENRNSMNQQISDDVEMSGARMDEVQGSPKLELDFNFDVLDAYWMKNIEDCDVDRVKDDDRELMEI